MLTSDIDLRHPIKALKNKDVGFWELDLTTQKLVWCDSTFELHGIDPARGPPTWDTWLESIHPDDKSAAEETTLAAITTGTALTVSYRAGGGQDGTWRRLLGRAQMSPGPAPRLVGTSCDMTPIALAYAYSIDLADLLGADEPCPGRDQQLAASVRDILADLFAIISQSG